MALASTKRLALPRYVTTVVRRSRKAGKTDEHQKLYAEEGQLYIVQGDLLDMKVIKALEVLSGDFIGDCGHECHRLFGPFIVEEPDCPIHGRG